MSVSPPCTRCPMPTPRARCANALRRARPAAATSLSDRYASKLRIYSALKSPSCSMENQMTAELPELKSAREKYAEERAKRLDANGGAILDRHQFQAYFDDPFTE